ncbi:MAG: hypothetical protein QOC72_1272 [Methylobacteriaceae bacterium]|jgi:hypothetical protein|nr:hypothetical protein [Methylobacteriaceae bacterium]
MSEHELMPAITLMERKVVEAERKVNELLSALNVLRAEAGLEPRPRGGGSTSADGAENAATQIKPDTFFGQKQQSAMRMYLQMRKSNGLGPAKPREIYDALLAGGYQFEAKDIENALVGMRALLRKRTEIFIRLPNGTYGLAAWYPNARRPKAAAATGTVAEEEEEDETAAPPDGVAAA